jgi:outer membrane immunogenic protein
LLETITLKNKLMIAAVLVAASGTAHAQSALDGAYAGLAYSSFSGENTYVGDGDYELTGEMAGVFIGLDRDMGSFVLGGEIAISGGAAYEEGYEDAYEYTSIIDLKGRIGYDAGPFMPYGILGVSVSTFEIDGGQTLDATQTGVLAGIGAEYAVTDQFAVGAELISRSFDIEDTDITGTVNSVSLRGSYSF